jgi:diacylglycerol O-acyltransferase 2, plant
MGGGGAQARPGAKEGASPARQRRASSSAAAKAPTAPTPAAAAAPSPPSSSPGYLELTTPPAESTLRHVADVALTALFAHYLLWFPAAVAALWAASAAVAAATGSARLGWAAFALPLLAYAPSYFDGSERTGHGRPWHALRLARFWRAGHRYVGLTMVRTSALDATKQYVFGWSPHGILILSRLGMYGGVFEALFPGVDVRCLGASPVFAWPGSREISLCLGAVDAGRATAQRVLSSGLSMIVYPGGSREIFETSEGSPDTVLELTHRRGFVHLAVKHGAALVPVVVFNERRAYTRIDPPGWLVRFCLRRLRLPLLLFYGRWGSLMPRAGVGLGIVFGAPIEVPHVPGADKGDAVVEAAAAAYHAALEALWEAHKARFGYSPHERLVIR